MKVFFYFLICLPAIISCTKEPVADFSYTGSTNVGDTIYFTNLSENCNRYEWSFGDGSSSNKKSPLHYFSQPRAYTVKLTVYGDGGSASIIKPMVIRGITYSFSNFSSTILNSFFSCYLNGSDIEDFIMHGTLQIGNTTETIVTKRIRIYAGFSLDGRDYMFVEPFDLIKNKHNDLIIWGIAFGKNGIAFLNETNENVKLVREIKH